MQKINMKKIYCNNGLTLRLIEKGDIDQYYDQGFSFVDEEINMCTGSQRVISKQSIVEYVNRIMDDETRYDLLICNLEDGIIGESVLNEIEWDTKNCNFRICLFRHETCGQGVGEQVIKETLKFGFETLKLHRIELEVFDFNHRAYRAYEKSGFIKEGIKRKAHLQEDGTYCDVIIMSILEEDYYTTQNVIYNGSKDE